MVLEQGRELADVRMTLLGNLGHPTTQADGELVGDVLEAPQLSHTTQADAIAAEFELFQFNREYDLPYPLLAEAQPLLDAYGIELIWGSVFYLIDPDGRVLAADLEPSALDTETFTSPVVPRGTVRVVW